MKRDYIQYDPKHYSQALVFDIDRDMSFEAASESNVLQPSFITHSKNNNGHAHFVYLLKTPIATHDHANFSPVRFAASIQRAYTRRLHADKGYACLITKNPATHDIIDFDRMFDLDEMDAWLDFSDKAPEYKNEHVQGLGRNCTMFDTVRVTAYREVCAFADYEKFHSWCFEQCCKINASFVNPLSISEPRATGKSIATWTWKNRYDLSNSNENRGVMMLDMMEDLSAKERQVAGALYTAKVKRDNSLSKIQAAYEMLKLAGKKPTQANVVNVTRLGIATVKRHWKELQK